MTTTTMISLLINAKQAKALSDNTDWLSSAEAEYVFKRIIKTAKKHKTYSCKLLNVSNETVENLEKLGYEIRLGYEIKLDAKEKYYNHITVSWENGNS